MRRADGCEAWSSEPPGLVPPHRGQALASAGEAAVKDAEGAAQRGVGEPKCAAFWGDRASLTGASSWLVRWENRDEAPLSDRTPMPPPSHRPPSGTVRNGTNKPPDTNASGLPS